MTVQTTYPGVDISEHNFQRTGHCRCFNVRDAPVGVARAGAWDRPTSIESYAEIVHRFGDLSTPGDHPMGRRALRRERRHCQAIIVRALPTANWNTTALTARGRGDWANSGRHGCSPWSLSHDQWQARAGTFRG